MVHLCMDRIFIESQENSRLLHEENVNYFFLGIREKNKPQSSHVVQFSRYEAVWHIREEGDSILFQTLNLKSSEEYTFLFKQAYKKCGSYLHEYKLYKELAPDVFRHFGTDIIVHHCPSERHKFVVAIQQYLPKDLCLFITCFLVGEYKYDMYRDRICKIEEF